MYRSLHTQKILAVLIIVLWVATSSAPSAFAADFTSSNFMARNPLTDTFGGIGTSSSFFSIGAGGQISNGQSTSTNFVLNGGAMYTDTFAPKSQNWRWYDDESHETPTSPLAAENTAPSSVQNLIPLKLRWTIKETAGIGSTAVKFKLQYATTSDFSSGGYDVVEQVSCVGNSAWCYTNGAGSDNGVITTGVISDSDSCTGSVGTGCGTHNESGTSTSAFTQVASAATEYEFTIEQSGAVANTVYFFRAVDVNSGDAVPLNTSASYPSLLAQSATLDFSIQGLPAATTTAGVTTAVNTTSTGVPFGSLPIGTTMTAAAQRLTVTTNATAGYHIFAYQRQGLLRDGAGEIPPVSATNDTPTAWASSCDPTSTGCYGYHTAANVLSGGSTRFAPDDTYAQFTSMPTEVAYSAVPVATSTTDIVYRVEAHDLQDAGDYSTDLVYIIVPTF